MSIPQVCSFFFVVGSVFKPFHDSNVQQDEKKSVKHIFNWYRTDPDSKYMSVVVPHNLAVNERASEDSIYDKERNQQDRESEIESSHVTRSDFQHLISKEQRKYHKGEAGVPLLNIVDTGD